MRLGKKTIYGRTLNKPDLEHNNHEEHEEGKK